MLELRDIERVGQAADIQHQVRILWDAELEAEGHHGKPHCCLCPAIWRKQITNALLVLGRGEKLRVDGVVCPLPEGLQGLPFLCQRFPGGDSLGNADGMAAAGLAVTAHQYIIRGIDE